MGFFRFIGECDGMGLVGDGLFMGVLLSFVYCCLLYAYFWKGKLEGRKKMKKKRNSLVISFFRVFGRMLLGWWNVGCVELFWWVWGNVLSWADLIFWIFFVGLGLLLVGRNGDRVCNVCIGVVQLCSVLFGLIYFILRCYFCKLRIVEYY